MQGLWDTLLDYSTQCGLFDGVLFGSSEDS